MTNVQKNVQFLLCIFFIIYIMKLDIKCHLFPISAFYIKIWEEKNGKGKQ